ncbi:40S ribosomal protein S20-1 [Dendrobium catenatum]|uniref:40S ribosomal protein S20-1 n=1 Tax=Dendrobium catenatum TaxID=906689 RepID=A0A2I0VML2_9ASPA|nr:40S ribosomal protein S20-1 [Dendrobium catenatum]
MKSISCEEKAQDKVHRVRITLSSKNVKNLEKVCSELVNGGMNKRLRIDGDEGAPQRVSPISCRGPYEDTEVLLETCKENRASTRTIRSPE